jgi:hypothetical protein
MTLYRMATPAYCLDENVLALFAEAGVRLVDKANAPWNVIFEGTEQALRAIHAEHWNEEMPMLFPAPSMPCAAVRRLYEVRIDFEFPEAEACDPELIVNEMFHVIFKFETDDTSLFPGNPACAPYFTAWLLDEGAAHELGRALVDRMVQLGCKVTS